MTSTPGEEIRRATLGNYRERHHGHEVDGYEIADARPDALVALNDQLQVDQLQAQYNIPPSRTVLLALEPRVTSPQMYTNRRLQRYGLRFAGSKIWAKDLAARTFLWPQTLNRHPSIPNHVFEVTIINGDKRSAVAGSLYGLRREVIRKVDSFGTDLAVFGSGWHSSRSERLREGAKASAKAGLAGSRPNVHEAFSDLGLKPRNWRGVIENKREAFATAPMTIVIENSADYVSEKLVDAVCSGVVPLYVGPRLEAFGLPAEIAHSCAPQTQQIVAALTKLTPIVASEIVSAGQAWLNSSESMVHDIHNVLTNLGQEIGESLAWA